MEKERKCCEGCLYSRPLFCRRESTGFMCHYLYDTGQLRGCDPEKCDKKKVVSPEEKKEYLRRLRARLINLPV